MSVLCVPFSLDSDSLGKQLLNYISKLGVPVVSCGRDSKMLAVVYYAP